MNKSHEINPSNKEFAIILRTCDLVSPKYPFATELYENKQFHFENLKNYAFLNNADLFIICDTKSDMYFQFVSETFQNSAAIIRSDSCSNGGSFAKQIELVKQLNHKFIEIAEDDFVKFGKVDWTKIKKDRFYTAYQHPLHDRIIYKKFCL